MELIGGFRRVAAAVPEGRALAVRTLPGLDEEILLRPGDGQAVVIPGLRQPDEVVAGLRCLLRKEHGFEDPGRGVEHRDGVACRRVCKLQLGRLHRRAGDGLHLAAAALIGKDAAPGQHSKTSRRQCCGKRPAPKSCLHNTAPLFIS